MLEELVEMYGLYINNRDRKIKFPFFFEINLINWSKQVLTEVQRYSSVFAEVQ